MGPWLSLGLVYFGVFGDNSGSGGVWDEEGACLVWNGGEVVVDCRFGQWFHWF